MHRTKVKIVEEALDANNTIAQANRADFDRAGVRVVNFMSAPGAGKTALLERVVADLPGVRVGVLEGDVQGSMDADRLASLHVPVTQLNTDPSFGGECHLDANMVRSALPELPLDEIDLLVIENVGNLVCPAEFRVGEDARIMVSAVTEGEEKPLKYPLMFRACELVLINKIDLLPHLDFDLDKFLYNLDAVHPGVERMLVSAKTGEGIEEWRDWLAAGRRAGGGARVTQALGSGRRSSAALAERTRANAEFFEAEAERLARLCHRMAERFARGGRLIAFGRSPAARSDARHVAVEFVHPVIVGKRALPALAPGGRGRAAGASRCALVAEPDDIAIGFGAARTAARPPRRSVARERGCLTLAFAPRRGGVGVRAAARRTPRSARSSSRRSTTCSGSSCTCSSTTAGCSRAARRGRCTTPAPRASSTRSSASSEHDLEAVVEDVRRSVLAKARGGRRAARADARARTAAELTAAADGPARDLDAGGRLLALGNGGSATDAMDVVADFRFPPDPAGRAAGARPDRGRRDPDRDRERHRDRGDLLAPGDRPRARRATRCSRSPRAATRRT